MFAKRFGHGGYLRMHTDEDLDRSKVDLGAWGPWARELLAIVEAVRLIGESSDVDVVRRLRLAELGARTRRLLTNIGCQPELPGVFGRALDVLRSPADADPVHISEAIARLGRLAVVIEASKPALVVVTSPRHRRPRNAACLDQPQLPGLEPTTINQGATS
jgi:hypothetical protein